MYGSESQSSQAGSVPGGQGRQGTSTQGTSTQGMSTQGMSTYGSSGGGSGRAPAQHLNEALRNLPPGEACVQYFRAYAREKPETMALWCLGIGFILGWKLKPW